MINHHVTKLGSKGDVVSLDQLLLYSAGIKIVPTGHYDEQTKQAVLQFQKNMNKCAKPSDKGHLLEDGKIGNYDGHETGGMGTREMLIMTFQRNYNYRHTYELKDKARLPEDGKMTPKVFEALKQHMSESVWNNEPQMAAFLKHQVEAAHHGSLVIGATGNRPNVEACSVSSGLPHSVSTVSLARGRP